MTAPLSSGTPAPRLLHHQVDGPLSAPPLVLGPSLGTSLAVWDGQVAGLARSHRVVRWDLPGHGGTPGALLAGAGGVAELGAHVLRLADALGIGRFAYAGISLGGAVGTWLAVHHPDRITSLALVCSSARFGEPQAWRERACLVRDEGIGPVAETATGRWFTADFARSPAARAALDDLRAVDPEAYATLCDALAAHDLRGELAGITAPTLVVAGREDPATPVAHARELADTIPGSTLIELPGASHLANVERPEPVRTALLSHFAPGTAPGADDASRHAAGLAVRRAVLGDAHVDRATARTTPFTAVFQDFITRYAWGEVWTRPGLDRRTRRCLTLTALVALGHHGELAMHLRAALSSGDLTPEDVQEVLLQAAVYCGVPAANAAFAAADRILAEITHAAAEN
ncbi:3-oxoadipate enol-lactonase/4-carboxymuconolactone decarboxylase [Streptomyces sp. CEV 2-1]|uniref:bifunctional 3-oxoadipate enol-lactonase/4-carboxymuconolactone decarboxylase PcaDC n=1 Tax=Streptomyces sp. CEV 2-1 TaxID=2485153 RepID=UPI000F495556|nr:4-carboxymuconolactone decarboxylase [Streptomyces sp. CEV 2-1]ROQ77903.1 3-oxoadipate enol-lactonase/4-carboxymuconolactone decarboxylase [Streptomyces sp. CEV 2-1]